MGELFERGDVSRSAERPDTHKDRGRRQGGSAEVLHERRVSGSQSLAAVRERKIRESGRRADGTLMRDSTHRQFVLKLNSRRLKRPRQWLWQLRCVWGLRLRPNRSLEVTPQKK